MPNKPDILDSLLTSGVRQYGPKVVQGAFAAAIFFGGVWLNNVNSRVNEAAGKADAAKGAVELLSTKIDLSTGDRYTGSDAVRDRRIIDAQMQTLVTQIEALNRRVERNERAIDALP